MSAQPALQQPRTRFWRGQAVLLLRPANPQLKVPARPPLEVTVREVAAVENATVLEGEVKPYVVTLDEGLCGGLPIWAAERELTERPAPPAKGRS